MQQQGTPLTEIGINGLITRIGEKTKLKHNTSISGFNDDASATFENGKYKLVSNVLFLEGVNFDLIYTPLKHLGYKAVVAAISDILAMNGRPEQLSITLGLSSKMMLESVDELMNGVLLACTQYNIDLVDFRPGASFTGLSVSAVITGTADENSIVTRKNGKPTDLLCVSGDLGSALMGLYLLEREKRVLKENDLVQPDFGNNDYILERQLKPEAKTYVIDFLEEMKLIPSAMVNVKNGLSAALWDICLASGTGCRIHETKIPLNQGTLKAAHEMNFNPLVAALNGGEDYELLFTLPLKDYEKVINDFPENINMIGYLTNPEDSCRLISNNNEEIDIKDIRNG